MSALATTQREFMAMLRAGRAPADPGLAFYHAAARANWHAALCATYPVIRRLVGEACFERLAGDYAARHPSRSGDLHRYGGALAEHIDAQEALAGLGYLGDVARLEWALHESLHAADAPSFDLAALAAVPAARQGALCPRLHPAARLLHPRCDVVAIWEANQAWRDGAPGALGPACAVLVAREGFHPRPVRLDSAEGRLLGAVARGATLDGCCAALGADAQRLGELLARHVASGVLAGFDGLA